MKAVDSSSEAAAAASGRTVHRMLAAGWWRHAAAGTAVIAGLLLVRYYGGYLLFHSLVEIFSIVVAFGIFTVFWNSRRFLDNGCFLFLGVAYLFIGGIDLLHTLAYQGMGVFEAPGSDLATQLWICGRYVESFSLLAAPLFLQIIDAMEKRDIDLAAALQQKAMQMIRICRLAPCGFLGASKALMKRLGLDCGEVRKPHRPPTAEEMAAFEKDLDEIGFFEYACK